MRNKRFLTCDDINLTGAIWALWDLCYFLVTLKKDTITLVILLFTGFIGLLQILHIVSYSSRYYVRRHAFNRLHNAIEENKCFIFRFIKILMK